MADFTVDDILAELGGGQDLGVTQPDFTVEDVMAEFQPSQTGLPGVPSEEFLPPSERLEPERDPSIGTGEFIGGTIGSVIGGKSPASIPLAGLGAAGGEAVEQITEHMRGVPTAPKTSMEALGRIEAAGARGIAGELIGRGALKLGGKALRLVKEKPVISKESQEAMDFLEENLPKQERGVLNPNRYLVGKEYDKKLTLLPAEATEGGFLDLLHNMAEKSIFGGGVIRLFKKDRLQAISNVANNLADDLGTKIDDNKLGEMIVESFKGNLKLARIPAQNFLNTAAHMADGTPVNLKGVQEFITPILTTSKKIGEIGAESAGEDLMKGVAKIGTTLEFGAAKALRTRLLNVAREYKRAGTNEEARLNIKKTVGLLNESMEKSLKDSGQLEALSHWKLGRSLWQESSKNFNNTFIKRLLKQGDPARGGDPEVLVNKILRNEGVSGIQRAKTGLGGKNSPDWKLLQSYYFHTALKDATDPVTKELSGKKLTVALANMGDQSLKEIFTTRQLKKIKGVANALNVIQGKQGAGTGGMFIQLSQAGAIVSVPSQGLGVAPASIVLGPGVLSKIFTSPTLANSLIHGLKSGTKSKIAAGAMGRFMTDVTNMQQAGGFEVPKEGGER